MISSGTHLLSRAAGGIICTLLLFAGGAGECLGENEPERFPFARGDWTLETCGIYGIGENAIGGKIRHDVVLGSFQVGYTLTDRLATDRFYSGTVELTGQLWGGGQVDPDSSYLVGIMPGMRYHFFTGSSWVPYVELGAGVLLTDIGEPDLGGKFQFNEYVGTGLHWFMNEQWALNMGYRAMHISNAGIEEPNRGVNNHLIILGMLYKF